jgi:hypothetical protein
MMPGMSSSSGIALASRKRSATLMRTSGSFAAVACFAPAAIFDSSSAISASRRPLSARFGRIRIM